jgi:polypeptide N-acetylgalactosaminyltransferase
MMFWYFLANLKKPLDNFVSKNLANRVKIIHLKKRQGLIRARLAGARKATSEVLLFLDSHTEANVNWLPPLLGKVWVI